MSEQFNLSLAERTWEASRARLGILKTLKSGAHIHLAGICGKGMANVAAMLKGRGFYISGSDKAFFPPMGEVARKNADKIYEGYAAENLSVRPDLVVIGNALSVGNAEVQRVLEEKIPFVSMTEVFEAELIGSRDVCPTSIVIAGTHGKTTTSSLTATLFDQAGWDPGFFIGGVSKELPGTVREVSRSEPLNRRVVVLEGDEYDSAWFAKWPKFLHYRADILVITSIEFDHADIYESVEQIEEEFFKVVCAVPKAGAIIACCDTERMRANIARWKSSLEVTAPVLSYGVSDSAELRVLKREQLATSKTEGTELAQRLVLQLAGGELVVETRLSGIHNAQNILAAAAAAERTGLCFEEIAKGVRVFSGAVGRQDVLGEHRGVLFINDFAHHPTAVAVTLSSLKERYPKRRLVAVLDPCSNTSRRAFFQIEYTESFSAADLVVIREVADAGGYSGTSGPIVALDVKRIVSELVGKNRDAHSFASVEEIEKFLIANLKSGDLCVLMSNGEFGKLPQTLPGRFGEG